MIFNIVEDLIPPDNEENGIIASKVKEFKNFLAPRLKISWHFRQSFNRQFICLEPFYYYIQNFLDYIHNILPLGMFSGCGTLVYVVPHDILSMTINCRYNCKNMLIIWKSFSLFSRYDLDTVHYISTIQQ